MLERIEPQGVLIADSTLPREGRASGAVPAHPNGIQVSRDRWLLLYATRRFRGVDDDCSICWQVRRGSPVGTVLKEGIFARSVNDWDALGDGRRSVRQHGHPVAFGVPKGAVIRGRPAPHANLFVAKWRRVARLFDAARNLVVHQKEAPDLRATLAVEWVQFRLNEAEDDLEILEPVQVMRQPGYEQGPAFCSAPGVRIMNQSFVPAVPLDAACTQWADPNHFDQRAVAVLKYRYDPARHCYAWVETGPLIALTDQPLTEASLAPVGDGTWVIAARTERGTGAAWVRTRDPFHEVPAPVITSAPRCSGPLSVYHCPDGALRLCTGDADASPYGRSRDPLYCWEIDPDTFAASNRRVIFDTVEAGLPLRAEATPIADMCKLLPHQGRTQYAVYRVRVRAIDHPYVDVTIDDAERAASAIYHSQLTYDHEYPPPWTFSA